jgi:enamine deaminase RidA (YjgF/YER057c/UK114 family)
VIEYVANAPGASFSLATVVSPPGRYVHVAGQVGFDGDGTLVPGGIVAEADATFDRIEAILAQAGGDLDNIVRMGVFLTSLEDYPAFVNVRTRRFPRNPPASTAVQVAGLLVGACVEIDAIAFVPDAGFAP